MLDSAPSRLDEATLQEASLSRVPVRALVSAGTISSFGWLLLQNKIHPVLVYLLQVYLTF